MAEKKLSSPITLAGRFQQGIILPKHQTSSFSLAILALVIFPYIILLVLASHDDSEDAAGWLNFLVISLVWAGVFLPFRGIVVVGIINLFIVLLAPLMLPTILEDFRSIIPSLILNLVAYPLVLFSLELRHRMEKQRQKAYQRAMERLEIALEAGKMGTWEWDVQTNEVIWSDYVEDIFRLARGTFDGTYPGYLKLIHPDDIKFVEDTIADAITGKTAEYSVEHQILNVDGFVHWIGANGRVYRDENDQPLRMTGVVTDITARKEAELELKKTLAREQYLHQVSQIISSTLDLSEMLPTIVRLGGELVNADAGIMSLVASDGQSIQHPYAYNLPEGLGLEQAIPKGHGVAWQVIETKTGILLDDYAQHPLALPVWVRAGIHGIIEVPLLAGEICLGILGLYRFDPAKKFRERDFAFAKTLGQQAGIAIQNARLFESVKRQLQELMVLQAVASAGARATNEDEFLGEVAQIVHQALYPDVFGIGLWDEQAQVLSPHAASRGLPEALRYTSFRLNQGIVGVVAAHRKPWRVPDVRLEPAFISPIPGMISELAVPILAGDRLLGILDVESKKPDAYSEEDERLLTTLAGQLATVMERLRIETSLRETETHRREMLEKVIMLGKAITRITDLDQCLQKIHQSIQKGLGFDRVGLFLYDAKSGYIQGAYGTSREGEMEIADSFRELPGDFEAWQLILQNPEGFNLVEDYQQRYEISEGMNMYGVSQNLILAAWSGEEPIALIAVDNLITGRYITPEDIKVLQLFAGYVGLAIENARWNAELEQRVMERTEQLEAANQELEAFSYSVSHDLRAPLRAIDGFSNMLGMVPRNNLDEDGQRYLSLIHDNVIRMTQLIDDLLAFSRLNRQPLQKQMTDPTQLAREVLEELQPEFAGREVDIRVDTLPACQADPSLLRQVFANLIGNAAKYSRPRKIAKIHVGWKEESNEIIYWIKDNGVGFNMKYVNKMFGVFQRLHSTNAFEGTGIGLAIVQRIITRHGGRIWVEAEEDQGATFFFTLSDL